MQESASVRIDLWLWAARFFRTRSLAKQAIEAGRVELDGAVCKPSRTVRVGDDLVIRRNDERFEITVTGLSDQRGPASAARLLYSESDEARARREGEAAERRAARAGYKPPESKPDKRARRLIRALGDIDAM
jgi:ribosome-associated heat shock protein Hsp15